MARLTLSAGMFAALASFMALRRLAFLSGSPPPARAAMLISRMSRVKILPRLESVAAFLCLIDAHLECPDMLFSLSERQNSSTKRLLTQSPRRVAAEWPGIRIDPRKCYNSSCWEEASMTKNMGRLDR